MSPEVPNQCDCKPERADANEDDHQQAEYPADCAKRIIGSALHRQLFFFFLALFFSAAESFRLNFCRKSFRDSPGFQP